MRFIPGTQAWLNLKKKKSIDVIHSINRQKKKNHEIVLIDGEKGFEKIQLQFTIKTLSKLREENTPDLTEKTYETLRSSYFIMTHWMRTPQNGKTKVPPHHQHLSVPPYQK